MGTEEYTAYRVTDYGAMPERHSFSVIATDSEATFVYGNRLVESGEPDEELIRYLARYGTPTTANGWAALLAQGDPYYGVEQIEAAGARDDTVRRELDLLAANALPDPFHGDEQIEAAGARDDTAWGHYEQPSANAHNQGEAQPETIAALLARSPELQSMLNGEELTHEPEGMRELIAAILQDAGTTHLNPDLADWLAGGEPPENFGGLVLFPEPTTDQ